MKHDELIDMLRASDPAPQENQARFDAAAAGRLREAILATSRVPEREVTVRGYRRKPVAIGAAAVLMAGAGAAYATYEHLYRGFGGGQGLTCSDTLAPEQSEEEARRAGGPLITGDPIADCLTYRQAAGYPAIDDPVAVTFNGSTYVVPRPAVQAAQSAGHQITEHTEGDPDVRALNDQLSDWVDGGASQCFDPSNAQDFVDQTLTELDLTGWTYRAGQHNRPHEDELSPA